MTQQCIHRIYKIVQLTNKHKYKQIEMIREICHILSTKEGQILLNTHCEFKNVITKKIHNLWNKNITEANEWNYNIFGHYLP